MNSSFKQFRVELRACQDNQKKVVNVFFFNEVNERTSVDVSRNGSLWQHLGGS